MAFLNIIFRGFFIKTGKCNKINISPVVRFTSTSSNAFKNVLLMKTAKEKLFVPEKRPILLLYSWLLAKNKHIQHYADIYGERGFDVLKVKTSARHVLWPKLLGNTIIEICEFLVSNPGRPILVHGFSVGGFVHIEVLRHLSNLAEKSKSEEVLSRLKGQIFDSAVDIVGVPEGISKAVFPKNPLLEKCAYESISMYLKLTKNHVAAVYQMASDTFYANDLGVPSLMLYSKSDPIADFHRIQTAISCWENKKIVVMSKCWTDSPHVGHFRQHKDDYVDSIDNFLRIIGLTSNITPKSIDDKSAKTETVVTADETINNSIDKPEKFTELKRRVLASHKSVP